jgi:protein TonB
MPAPASVAPVSGVRDSLPLKAQGDANTNAPAARPGNAAAGVTHKEPVAQVAATGHGDAAPEKAKQRYLREHFTYIRDLVMKGLVYPHQARKMGWSGKVTVSFLVCEDGSAREVKVVESSGHQMLDRCAIETIRKVAPFPKPPLPAEIVIPVLFKLM